MSTTDTEAPDDGVLVNVDLTGGTATSSQSVLAAARGETAAPASILDDLLASLTARPGRVPVTVAIPGLPGWGIKCRTDLDGEKDLDKWQSWAKKDNGDIDGLGFSTRLLAETCIELVKGPQTVRDDVGPVTFKSASLQARLGVLDEMLAVRKLFGNDLAVIPAANLVLAKAGYNEAAKELDFTTG